MEKQANESIAKYCNEHIYIYWQFLGYWNPIGFIPEDCRMNCFYLIGTRRKNDGGIGEDGGDDIKKEKTTNLCERITMYTELAYKAREARAYFGGSAVTWWRHGDEEILGWSERKGISCIIQWSSMRGKLSRLPINYISSSVHRMCRWTYL